MEQDGSTSRIPLRLRVGRQSRGRFGLQPLFQRLSEKRQTRQGTGNKYSGAKVKRLHQVNLQHEPRKHGGFHIVGVGVPLREVLLT